MTINEDYLVSTIDIREQEKGHCGGGQDADRPSSCVHYLRYAVRDRGCSIADSWYLAR